MAKATSPTFVNAIVVKQLPENCPDWVISKMGIHVETFLAEIEQFEKDGAINNGWINLEQKRAKNGKLYVELNTWKPEAKAKAKRKARS